MGDEHVVDKIPKALPQQSPIPKPRSDAFVRSFLQSRHFGTTHVTEQDGRTTQRGYTAHQVAQTLAEGHQYQDRKGNPDVSLFKLNSIDTPGTRRVIVADTSRRELITAYPREPIPQASEPVSRPTSNTAKKKKEQKLRKQQRSMEANGG